MKKRLFVLALAALMMLSLCACGVSSSSSSNVTITTSTTDENGNTTTKTSTAEAGVTVGTDGIHTNVSTSSSTTDGRELPDFDEWADQFTGFAYGENEDGDGFWFAYDNDPFTYAALLMTVENGDSTHYFYRAGDVLLEGEGEEEHYILLYSDDMAIPFDIYESDSADFQLFFFADGDSAEMTVQDTDEFVEEFYGNVQAIWNAQEENSAADKIGGSSAGMQAGKKSSSKSREMEDIRATWAGIYGEGAEGINDTGEMFLLAVDDFSDIQKASFMMISADGKSLVLYVVGSVEMTDDGPVLFDDYEDINLPFDLEETEDGFDMYFQDGDVAHMVFFDQDKILDDMLMIVAAGRK